MPVLDHLIRPTCVQNSTSVLFSPSRDMNGHAKFKLGHTTTRYNNFSLFFKMVVHAFNALKKVQEEHLACKKLSSGMLAWYVSGARCSFAYGPADATTTHYLLLQQIQIGTFTFLVLPFWCRLTQVVPDKIQRAINGSSSSKVK